MNITINTESEETQHQTVSFADQTPQWNYSVDNQLDFAHKTADSNAADMNNFFSRPIKIASINWTVGSTFGTTINPWTLYFTNLRVINRISNYNLLRSKLCVRIMINGNGFHYGRALASYRPLHNSDQMIAWRFGLFPEDVIGASQRMHVWLDPTKSQGGTLCLPYVNYNNAMNIPDQGWNEMGELDIASVTTLEHANGGTDSVTISVFAWAEDVSLSMPTISEPGALAPQMWEPQSNEADEASVGPISARANALTAAATSLAAIPELSSVASGVASVSSKVSSVARMFGLSRPVDTGPIQSYKPSYVGNLPNANTLDTSTKLTYDVRQETTISPSAVGLGPDDEMAIASIAARESYLTQFNWGTNDIPESLLWTCFVFPTLFNNTTTSPVEHHLTPMAYAALPFKHWRGSIKYRFQIVASAFHKGRLKIVYEPYLSPTGASEYNVQETHIIDLAKERDFTVQIGWGQGQSYLDVRDLSLVPFRENLHFGGALRESANGLICVYVVNDLTTPSSDLSDISVLVSVSAGDDFEVVNPSDTLDDKTFWEPQSLGFGDDIWEPQADLNVADADKTTDESSPVGEQVDNDFAAPIKSDLTNSIYYGDPIVSVRQLLKRYELYRAHCVVDLETTSVNTLPDFPMYRGYAVGLSAGVDNAATPANPTPYNFVQTTMMNWFTPCFLARRGGIRHKFIWTVNAQPNGGILAVTRTADPIGYQRFTRPFWTDVSRSSAVVAATSRSIPGYSGSLMTPVLANPVLEADIPYHSKYRFKPARRKNQNSVSDLNSFHQLTYPTNTFGGGVAVLDYVAASEDFSLGFFQACPVFYTATDPNPSTTV